ncbi:conserved hypothetical protein [Afipia carboxidovorans OM5]|uniref:Uncharacterized protein n=1 Tax=Afipia carboxidovorans (strain ATCC 49405 / DSM 1227 / KCTC 32145 / OM5) TaxID=504832 RepID=B6JEW0_AFIC5|nr:hypothetical protein [Afipia carboxidovorans]ACI94062.1 conserved hypothetical protein [Afipia carboxidovorans OM5]AEI02276.1 hypothetical protein OCA4_c11330 [Afipia carboxidovorans OM4]AEI05852.1 hypothetical protein OCA5_c11330 [Afipia carboxidovorans OM5]
MPPLVLIALGVMGGAALVRFAMKESRRINRELDEAREQAVSEQTDAVRLRRDPQTGTYRPH